MNETPAASDLLPCPSCAETMMSLHAAALPHGSLALDYCVRCRGIWFDPHESTRLAPVSVLDLFRIIRDSHEAPTLPLAARLVCPRCRSELRATRDISRGGPFAYHRCPYGHGRFTPFAQFLTEKGFVRHLAKKEIEKVAAAVGRIACHACGAPIDLRTDTACTHCRAPVAVLDPDAMAKALEGYDKKAMAPRVREIAGDLTVSVRNLPFLPERRSTSLLELGIDAVANLFE